MIEIPLTKGYVTVVDDEDADLANLKWQTSTNGYAERTEMRSGVRYHYRMNRVIVERMVGRKLSKDEIADHRDCDPLNNTRSNLRIANSCQSAANKRPRPNQYKGVVKQRLSGYWRASIGVNKEHIWLGDYNTQEDAAIAYNHAAKHYYNEFANTNDIPGWESITPQRRSQINGHRKNNSSGIPNVHLHKKSGKWEASVQRNKKKIYLGVWNTPEDAKNAVQEFIENEKKGVK